MARRCKAFEQLAQEEYNRNYNMRLLVDIGDERMYRVFMPKVLYPYYKLFRDHLHSKASEFSADHVQIDCGNCTDGNGRLRLMTADIRLDEIERLSNHEYIIALILASYMCKLDEKSPRKHISDPWGIIRCQHLCVDKDDNKLVRVSLYTWIGSWAS